MLLLLLGTLKITLIQMYSKTLLSLYLQELLASYMYIEDTRFTFSNSS